MSKELLHCPLCGNKNPKTWWDYVSEDWEGYNEGFNIKCCYIHVTAIYKEDCEGIWNTRAN